MELAAVRWTAGARKTAGFSASMCFAKYVKVAFFHGTSLRPVPPGKSKTKHTRYLNIHEDDELDEAQFTAWVKQASPAPRRKDVSGRRGVMQVRAGTAG